MRFIVDLVLAADFDQEGNLNIDEEDDFGLGADAPKNELVLVSFSASDEDPKGHQEDLDSCATSEFDENTTSTKPAKAIRCAFMASLPY